MNGKILILLIKLNKSSLELPFVLFLFYFFFLLTVLSEKRAGVLTETHSLHWMQQPLERSLNLSIKVQGPVDQGGSGLDQWFMHEGLTVNLTALNW